MAPPETDELPTDALPPEADGDDAPESLNLEVEVASPGACERRVTVTISRDDIERYFDNAYSDLMPSASVPGFRAGRAPRKLVEQKFKDEVADQVKGSLLMDSLSQISEEQSFAAISEPDLDLSAVEIPDDGPLTFEFSIEVRPDFDLPKWKGLEIARPTREYSDADIDAQVEKMLSRYGQLTPHDGPAAAGDYITANVTCRAGGKVVAEDEERLIRVRETLSFSDSRIEGFVALAEGKKAGDVITTTATLTQDAPNEAQRGQEVEVELKVLEVKKLKLPELTEEFLDEIGDFKSEEDFRTAVRQNLERQLEYAQQQKAREQITSLLTESADWDLPQGLLKRQSSRELERAVMELRRSGFSEAEIRARENDLRQNSAASTASALKEHFILERIAEEESLDVEEGDYDKEIFLISMQSGESPRRVRAQLEKRGLMDVLRNQIIERKVMELVQSEAKFQDEPFDQAEADVEAISFFAGGGEGDIPQATEEAEAAARAEEAKKPVNVSGSGKQ
ncbi:Trigger factor [Pseudobythopirellula maris]|uniref:Trigger factor n=1 Tax=Pseudobythopirellula maris TaxID=2527991 RepID=A0A5C5ZPZ8_9BACT|nr:trigger factor [Pseudobythopirellula maris]TWT88881.1 Trigger factor [Pseudobythopirellula maris]